ncbi:hypothetical protein AKG08_25215 [Achromobacter piechaudii]|nr:addiction module antidote protein [Achromobacter piechaudii]KNY05694.1 hypothetical protein AKG08_25215 [Achromobacter piechaudii]CAB3925178.1 hypothetical protein LMG2828_05955 [Achromobacter piechaudii]CAB3955720.1 hypothetical protein LMG6103_04602 [Achromobacter piechaudii]
MVQLSAYDPAEYLADDETIGHYLSLAAADENPDVFLRALSDVTRARGMTEVAALTGLGRASLYKALKPGANPSYLTVRKLMAAVGVSFSAAVKKADAVTHA